MKRTLLKVYKVFFDNISFFSDDFGREVIGSEGTKTRQHYSGKYIYTRNA